MTTMILGLALFFGLHLIPMRPAFRQSMIDRMGRWPYMIFFSVVSIAGIWLIARGYGQAQALVRGNPDLWNPPRWTRHIAFALMLPAFILLVAAYVPSRIRTAAKHPMLAAIKLWAVAHLLVRGDLASIVLFGSFLIWAIEDRVSVKRRAALGPLGTKTGGLTNDVIVVVLGIALYAFMLLWAHGRLIGIPLIVR